MFLIFDKDEVSSKFLRDALPVVEILSNLAWAPVESQVSRILANISLKEDMSDFLAPEKILHILHKIYVRIKERPTDNYVNSQIARCLANISSQGK